MPITNRAETKEHGWKSEVKALREEFNNLAWQVAHSMPGVVLSDPALKAGTSSDITLRTETFTFTFRGLVVSAAAAETAFTDTTHDVAASKEAWFVLSVQTDGTTFTITKAADQTIGTKVLPTAPDNEVIVGYLGMVSGASGFNANTDTLEEDGTIITSLDYVSAKFVRTVNIADGTAITA